MSDQTKDQLKGEEPQLSPAELKKRAKAEKQARRAAQKGQAGNEGEATAPTTNGVAKEVKQEGVQQPQKQQSQKAKAQQQKQPGQSSQPQQLQHRRTGSQGTTQMPVREKTVQVAKEPKRESKQVELVSHLYTQSRRQTFEGVSKDVHPSVLALGFKMSSYEICGSTARCVAMLLAFKDAIQEYTTPAGTSLARHMTSHHLSPQIDYLKSCRPISESMGNAIRWLKKLIVEIDPNYPEHEAKNYLCENIDRFIQERITVPAQAISQALLDGDRIKNGSIVLTFAKSSIVEQAILRAKSEGKKFRVIVVDSRPLFEGKHLATSLLRSGLEVEYLPFSGLAHAIKQATVVLLGAHSMLSNGRVQSRIGTASVAMQAHRAAIPVIVCCESVKFSGKVALDSIVHNEVAPSEELLVPSSYTQQPGSSIDESINEPKAKSLSDWKDIQHLQILNLMHDVTPAEYISMIICEYGSLPPTSVPVVHRLANEGEV